MMMKVKGFKVVDIPLSSTSITKHSFFIKEHTENKVTKGNGVTLFVGNIDYKCNLSNEAIHDLLTDIFGVFGTIDSISISDFSNDSTRNARFAHIEFQHKSTLKAILSDSSSTIFNNLGSSIAEKWGLSSSSTKKTVADIKAQYSYDYVNAKELKEGASEYLKEYEEQEHQESLKRSKEQEADEDGFIQVSYKKRRGMDDDDTNNNNTKNKTKKSNHHRTGKIGRKRSHQNTDNKTKELTNFYRFQVKEDKQNKLVELRKQFEQDKQKIATLKATRKLKPF